MRAASLIITVDRGSLKAYRVVETATRGASLKLVQAFEIPNADAESRTNHTRPLADLPQLEMEENRRICRQLAQEIATIVRQMPGEGWSLAAPTSIYWGIVGVLPTEIHERIVEHVESDLVKTEPAKLPAHFLSLQPI